MGIFRRISSIIKGFFSVLVGRVEERSPEALFEDIKNKIEKTKKETEKQIIDIKTNAELIRMEIKNTEEALSNTNYKIEAAKMGGDKEILADLLILRDEQIINLEMYKTTYNHAHIEVSKIKDDYAIFNTEMKEKLNQLKTLKTQAKLASLKENINSINNRYTASTGKIGQINDSIERMREIINRKSARADAIESLNTEDTGLKIKKLEISAARERALKRAELILNPQGREIEIQSKEA